jgi:hypothetical protein
MGAGGVICLADGKRLKCGIERGDVLSLYEVRGDSLFTKAFYMCSHHRYPLSQLNKKLPSTSDTAEAFNTNTATPSAATE